MQDDLNHPARVGGGIRMKTPRYTDGHKYPQGYRKAAATDVRLTFRRERERLKAAAEQAAKDEVERQAKVRRLSK